MPRLKDSTRTRRRLDLEQAARALFLERGFHGVGLREIAEAARVSTANLYNHFASKEALYQSLLDRLYAEFLGPDQPLARFFATRRTLADLEEFGVAIEQMVRRHRDYLLLVLVDVAELGGRHVRRHYAGTDRKIAKALGPHASRAVVFAYSAAYMQLFNFFMVEHLFGVKKHHGVNHARFVKEIAAIFRKGSR
jgi:AcrR family transcriptional regulator